MEPNFHNAQYLLTDKLSYRVGEPKRGDVVVFKAPPDYKEEYIKRIVALPGETISIRHNTVYINGKVLNEKYLPPEAVTYPGNFLNEGQILIVPEGKYFMMGDNREHSLDSRRFGFIGADKITGKAWIIYWPLTDAGKIPEAVFALE